uniref:Olfactory receptor n=1 Tax=Sinocyclocheilus grahami TaxID=75366 RepID=A0A672S8T0_SINGR
MLNNRLFVTVSHIYLVSSLKAKHTARKLDCTKRTGMQNTSDPIIQPAGFYIVALSSMHYSNVYVTFLTVIYVITIMCNVFLIAIIFYDHRLHVPKFMAVGCLALVDLVLSTSLVPGMIKTSIVLDNFVPFKLGLLQMFTYYNFLSLESLSLCILSYDRFIAICFPLKQKSINTNIRMAYIICVVWFFNSVRSLYTIFAPVLRLSCNDITTQWNFATTLFNAVPLIFLTYMGIPIAVFRMKNNQSHYKALGTCSEHLILVAIFFIPIFIIFNLGLFGIVINPNVRTVCLSLSSFLPPCVNPILYSLKTKKIQIYLYNILFCKMTRQKPN